MHLKLTIPARLICSFLPGLMVVWCVSVPMAGRAQQSAVWGDFYQPQRSEMLAGQARLALLEGRYVEAELLIDQAIQVNRASFGLYNPAQLQLLDQLLEALLVQEKWQEFDEKLDYLNWLSRRIFADEPEQLANGLLRQSDWHRAAAGVIQSSQSAWYLIQGKYLNWQAVSVLENYYGKQDPSLAPVLYQIVMEHYYQSVLNQRRGTSSYDFKTDGKAIVNGLMYSRNESVRRSYRIGRDNLQRIREIYRGAPGVSPATDPLLQIQQADWEFVHGNNQLALQIYRNAYSDLLDAGINEQAVDRYFEQLTVLPVQNLQVEWPAVAAVTDGTVLEYSAWSSLYPGAQSPVEFRQPPFRSASDLPRRALVEVTLEMVGDPQGGDFQYGVTRLQPVNTEAVDAPVTSQVLNEVSALVFRPRLLAGEVRSHDRFVIDFQFTQD